MTTADAVLVTGYPAFGARQVVEELVRREPETRVFAVVRDKFRAEAEAHARGLDARSIELVEGDATHMDLGLSGAELRRIGGELGRIHHCAQATYLGVDRATAESLNVTATEEVLELAALSPNLRCLVHHSTAFVSGDRTGLVFEADLEADQRFSNVIAETKARAEKLVRAAMRRLPIAVLRPTNVVGDVASGATDRLDGPYLVILLILASPAEIPLLLPSSGATKLHMVPIDFVARAAVAIGDDARSPGRTFHLADPDPPTAKAFFDLVARAGGKRSPRGFLPANVTKALLHTPGLERFARSPRSLVDQLLTDVSYDATNADAVLGPLGVSCPPVAGYVGKLVDYVKERVAERRAPAREDAVEADDPLS